jgi:hypothetical protein
MVLYEGEEEEEESILNFEILTSKKPMSKTYISHTNFNN